MKVFLLILVVLAFFASVKTQACPQCSYIMNACFYQLECRKAFGEFHDCAKENCPYIPQKDNNKEWIQCYTYECKEFQQSTYTQFMKCLAKNCIHEENI